MNLVDGSVMCVLEYRGGGIGSGGRGGGSALRVMEEVSGELSVIVGRVADR